MQAVEPIHPKLAPTLEADLLKLTAMQRLYTEHRAKGVDPIAAATAAGSESPKEYAAICEVHPRIKRILHGTAREALSKLTLDRNDVLNGLMDAVRAAATSTEMTAAWREIGKVIGAYEPEVVKHKHELTRDQLEVMTEDELIALSGEEDFRLPDDADAAIDAEFEVLSSEVEAEAPDD